MLLDVTGILFAAQLVILLTLGPYADYGNWRPYIMMGESMFSFNTNCTVFQAVLCICQFAMCGLSRAGQWQAAQALYVIGSLGKYS
jgi:hypothetical protein